MSQYVVVQKENEVSSTYILKDLLNHAEVEISPSIGSNLYRFTIHGEDIILPPPNEAELRRRSSAYGIPILFPPNRIKEAQFTFGNRTYTFPKNENTNHLHGGLRHKPWKVIDFGISDALGASITAEFQIVDYFHYYAYFPHDLHFQFTYRLKDGRLYCEGTILNQGDTPAPFGLGFHPYFSIPTTDLEKAIMTVGVKKEFPLNHEGFITDLPSETETSLAIANGMRVIDFQPTRPDHCLFTLTEGANPCTITFPSKKRSLIFHFSDHFPFLAVFKPSWANAISIEPYSCVTDAFNLDLPQTYTGARGLAPAEKFSFHWSIYLEEEERWT